MKKSDNVINVQLSDNQGKLHIRIAGWYIPKDFDDYSFELLINGKKTECSVEHITREDKLDELLERGLNRDCEIGFIVKADTDKTDINEIKFAVVDSGEAKELASLDNKDIGYTIEEQLLQYKMYKYMAYELKDRQTDADMILYKDPTIPEEVKEYAEPVDLDELLGDLTLKKLNEIFKEVMKRQVDKIDPVRSKFGKIEKEEVTVSDKFIYIHEYMHTHHKFSFRQLLEKQKSKMHIVVTFLAVLEMMKLGEIRVEQEETCGEIMIERVEEAYGN